MVFDNSCGSARRRAIDRGPVTLNHSLLPRLHITRGQDNRLFPVPRVTGARHFVYLKIRLGKSLALIPIFVSTRASSRPFSCEDDVLRSK
jgi:hypothetical protein